MPACLFSPGSGKLHRHFRFALRKASPQASSRALVPLCIINRATTGHHSPCNLNVGELKSGAPAVHGPSIRRLSKHCHRHPSTPPTTRRLSLLVHPPLPNDPNPFHRQLTARPSLASIIIIAQMACMKQHHHHNNAQHALSMHRAVQSELIILPPTGPKFPCSNTDNCDR